MQNNAPVIETIQLSRSIQTSHECIQLVNNISMAVYPGEMVAVTGSSGSGKSSLLYLLGLLDKPNSGDILIEGKRTKELNAQQLAQLRLEKLGFVFQFHFLIREFSLLDNIILPMKKSNTLSDSAIQARAYALLEKLGLYEKSQRKPNELSGGERQRVAIARALANEPKIIIADEPTGSLDSKNSNNVFELLLSIAHEDNKSVILVTHEQALADRADREIRLIDGSIL